MRISDWSSDVCSSDLSSLWNFGGATAEVPAEATAFGDRSMGWMYSLDGVWSDPGDDAANIAWARDGWTASERFGHHGRVYLDRKGGVWGKRVSVRFDLGGTRIIKKKNQEQNK